MMLQPASNIQLDRRATRYLPPTVKTCNGGEGNSWNETRTHNQHMTVTPYHIDTRSVDDRNGMAHPITNTLQQGQFKYGRTGHVWCTNNTDRKLLCQTGRHCCSLSNNRSIYAYLRDLDATRCEIVNFATDCPATAYRQALKSDTQEN
jgi:hypothetical protein